MHKRQTDDTVRRLVRAVPYSFQLPQLRRRLVLIAHERYIPVPRERNVAHFVPNRDLRVLFANWINTLRKDPILTRHRDAPVSDFCVWCAASICADEVAVAPSEYCAEAAESRVGM